MRDRSKDKRARLIDTLLSSPEYARNWAKYWRDVIKFHATNENPSRVRFDALEDWLAKQFQANTPWDEIVSGHDHGHRPQRRERGRRASRWPTKPSRSRWRARSRGSSWASRSSAPSATTTRPTRGSGGSFTSSRHSSPACGRRQVVAGGTGQPPVIAVVAQGPRRYTMPDKDNPTKQIPIAPRFFLSSSKSKPEPALPEASASRAAGAGRLVRHRPGQPLVRQGVHQPDLVRADGRGVLRADRRHRARADRQGPGGARAAGRRSGKRGATTSAGCSARS